MRRIKTIGGNRRFSYCFGTSTNTLIGSSIPQVQRRTTERIPDLECFKGPTKTYCNLIDTSFWCQPDSDQENLSVFVSPYSFVRAMQAGHLSSLKLKRTRLQLAQSPMVSNQVKEQEYGVKIKSNGFSIGLHNHSYSLNGLCMSHTV